MALLVRRWETVRAGRRPVRPDRRRAGARQVAADRGVSLPAARDAAHLGRMELLAASAEHAAASDRRMGPPAVWRRGRLRPSGGSPTSKTRSRWSSSIRRRTSPLLAPLVDIPLPPDRASNSAPEELRRRQLAAMTAWVLAGARSSR